jgi:opacity protein-like surface antigen
MRNVTLTVTTLLITAAAAYGVGLGLGAYYLIGMPMGDLTVSELTIQGTNLDVDMESGIPFKMGPANFGVGAVLNVIPMFGIEGGFEIHTGYKNKEADVRYELFGLTNEWTEPEDNTTWTMMNLYVGGRANIPTGTLVEPFGGGGLILSVNKFEPENEWLGNELEFKQYIQATNIGVYFGGGVNFFVTRKVAITVPIKYNMLFSGDYTYYVRDTKMGGYSEKWQPPAYLTFGGGVTVYPI